MSKINILQISFLLFLLINLTNCGVLIKAGNEMAFSCDKNVYLITIDVLFSGKPPKDQYPFTLKLSIPDKLQFKCRGTQRYFGIFIQNF